VASKGRASLRGLRTFCTAAARESFRSAADELFITPSAVSHQIRSLEEELGVLLFDRSTRDLKLSEAGRELYEEIRPIIEQLDAAISRFGGKGAKSTIRMSVQPFFGSEYFVPRLSEFTSANPEIDIQVRASDESAETHPADADMSIRLFRSPPPGLQSRRLFPLRLVPAGSKALARSVRVKGGAIVSDFPIIVHETYPRAWKDWSKTSGISLPEDSKVTRLDSMIAVVRAVEQGIGAALVPVPLADQWFSQGTITRLFDAELVADSSYYLVWEEDQADDEALSRFRRWILRKFTEEG
jgi:LysR family glycine cleavage system transcriptional activator